MMYLILHRERSPDGLAIWWRPDRSGYTSNVDQAGRYGKEEADSIAAIRGDDFPVPEDWLGTKIKTRCVVSVEDRENFVLLNRVKLGVEP